MKTEEELRFLKNFILASAYTEQDLIQELMNRVHDKAGLSEWKRNLAQHGFGNLSIVFGCPEMMGIEVEPQDRSIFDGPFPPATK